MKKDENIVFLFLKLVAFLLLKAVFTFFFSSLIVYYILHSIQNFVEIDPIIVKYIFIGAGAFFSFCSIIYSVVQGFEKKESRIIFWLKKNRSKIIVSAASISILLASITNEVIWTSDEINNILTIEWTIFGLSLTIFLVWDVIIVEYLKRKQPVATGTESFIEKYDLLEKRQSFLREVESTFLITVLLAVNLLLLLVSTGLVYICLFQEEVVTQTIVLCTYDFIAFF